MCIMFSYNSLFLWNIFFKLLFYLNCRLIYFTILWWFFHTLIWISHGCTCVPPSWIALPPPFLPHPTGLSIALTRQALVDKVMSLLFNMLSKFVITFLPRSLLILGLESPSAMILEPRKKVCHCFPIYLPWSDGTGHHDLQFLNVEL